MKNSNKYFLPIISSLYILLLITALICTFLYIQTVAGICLALCIILLPFVFNSYIKNEKEYRREKLEFETSLALLKNSLDSLGEGLMILGESGNVILANQSAKKLLSVNGEESNIITESESPALKSLIKQAKSGSHAETGLIFEGIEYQVSADPVFDRGAVRAISVLILRESAKVKSELIRREFTANVSHELKTPLHAISGYAELLKNKMVRPEDTDRFLNNIWSEAQRLVDLIDDTIKLSRLDESASEMAREELDLYTLAEGTLSLLETKAERAGVTLSLSGDSATIEGIPQLIEGLIFNLVDNAIKYNRENGSVSVEVKNAEKTATVSVCDTGIGIPKEFQERVFERFYRVDKSHSKEVGGTGLGLSIVKHTAKLHQADIELYSVENGGTSVSVIFPK